MNALLIDNDLMTLEALSYNLLKRGHMVCTAQNGRDGLDFARGTTPEVVVLDISLPHLGGLEVCRQIRNDSNVPIVFLTAMADESDRLAGLHAGADDYMVKPFSMNVLMARLESLTARNDRLTLGNVHAGGVDIYVSSHAVVVRGKKVNLTPLEFKLLHFLATHPGRVYTRQDLMREVWLKPTAMGASVGKTVDVHMHKLRDIIEVDPASPKILRTVQGYGFKFETEHQDQS